MANPFTAPTLSGYNASPPSDDGSATASNTIKWATHIDKIGDPLKTYAQAISSRSSTAFGKLFGNDFSEKSIAYTIANSDQGKVIVFTGTSNNTFTLPAAASVGSNFCVGVLNAGQGTLTIDGNSSETINGDTTLALKYSLQGAILVSDGSSWYALVAEGDNGEDESIGGSAVAKTNDTALQAIFTHTLRRNRWYEFETTFTYSQNGGDIKIAGVFTQTPQEIGPFMIEAASESGDYRIVVDADITSGANSITTMTDGDDVAVTVRGVFQTNATTGGTFQLTAAQATSDSSPTTIAGTRRSVVRDLAS